VWSGWSKTAGHETLQGLEWQLKDQLDANERETASATAALESKCHARTEQLLRRIDAFKRAEEPKKMEDGAGE
jgi:hypothetical protein